LFSLADHLARAWPAIADPAELVSDAFAGDDLVDEYLADKKGFVRRVVRPFRDKSEPIYVVPGSDAESHVTKRFPHKQLRRVNGSLRLRGDPRLLMRFGKCFPS
jgi:U3 small nucleolar RNA-associated protein 14